jgi:hypothetical protein
MSRRNKPCSRSRSSALSSKCQDPASMLHVANTPESPLPVMGNASVAPPPLGGRPHDNARRKGTNDGEHDGNWANTSHKIKFPKFVGSGIQCCGLTAASITSSFAVLRRTSESRWPPSTFSTTPKSGTTASSSTATHHHGTILFSSLTQASGHP